MRFVDERAHKMPERAIVRELRDRIHADTRANGGTLPREAAIAWEGYLAGLIEWDVLGVSEHDRTRDSGAAALCIYRDALRAAKGRARVKW